MNKEDETLIKTFFSGNSYAKNTQTLYTLALTKYSQYHKLTLEELLTEAETEEDQGVRKRRRKIGTRITEFKSALEYMQKSPSTIKSYTNAIRSFYDYYDVTPPKIKFKNGSIGLEKNYGRLLKQEDIRKMCDAGDTRARAIIYTLALTGLSQAELRRIKIYQLLSAATEVLERPVKSVEEFIDLEEELNNEILTLYITREKVHHRYFTFLPPEATRQIIAYLRERVNSENEKLHPSKYHNNGLLFLSVSGNPLSNYALRILIVRCGRYAGFESTSENRAYSYWRGHALRKYFISTFKNKTGEGELAEWLAGHKPRFTDETYWYKDIDDLKEKYMAALEYLSIENTRVKDIETKDYKEVMKNLPVVGWVLELLDDDPEFQKEAKKALNRKKKILKNNENYLLIFIL
ncbi:site-specific integrase [Methanobacterium ferruginis]|uniref:site-specific integrase n=1 Tax=Methanobacterium ferruginis TaxID=710191 RepID=UPI0025724171|nr:site-specific integrase [Methanobacterium ferruginis]BDZ68554.1 hypothetical protein GCM10025860_20020 [Methanobacterium ferruginis]